MKKKFYFIVPFLVLVLIFGFGLNSCKTEEIIEEPIEEIIEELIEEMEESLIEVSKTINVAYLVVGINTDEVSITYSNYQGGTEQKNGLKLEDSLEDIFQNPNLHVYDTSHYNNNKEKYKAEVIFIHHGEPLENRFLYVSAQNQNSYGVVYVEIIIDGIAWKSSKAEGEYCIATADGY